MATVGPARVRRRLDHLRAQCLPGSCADWPGCPVCRTCCARTTCAPPTKHTGSEVGDLRWFYIYSGVVWCCVFMHGLPARALRRMDDIALFDPCWRSSEETRQCCFPVHQIPAHRLAAERPELLRSLVLQRPRPQQRRLRHLPASATARSRCEGCVPARPPRRRADHRCTCRTPSTRTGSARTSATTASRSGEPLHSLRIRLDKTRGASPRTSPGTACSTSYRNSATSCAPAIGSRSTRSALPSGFLEWTSGDRRRVDHSRPEGLDRQPGPVLGHPPDRRAEPPDASRPAVRGHVGGSTCRSPSKVLDRHHHPGEPNGFRSLNDCTRIWKDGRVEQLGWPRVKITTPQAPGSRPAPPSRPPPPATVRRCVSTWVKLPCPIHVGGGYGGDSDWIHGMWKGEKFTEAAHLRRDRSGDHRPGQIRGDRPCRPGGVPRQFW